MIKLTIILPDIKKNIVHIIVMDDWILRTVLTHTFIFYFFKYISLHLKIKNFDIFLIIIYNYNVRCINDGFYNAL